MYASSSDSVDAPLGEGATMIAFRPFSALMMLLAGVAAGLVEGVIAPTTPTGRAISTRPFSGSSAMTPTDLTPARSRKRPIVLRRFFAILSLTLPSPVSLTASSASARLCSGSTIAQPAAVTISSTSSCVAASTIACAARARPTSAAMVATASPVTGSRSLPPMSFSLDLRERRTCAQEREKRENGGAGEGHRTILVDFGAEQKNCAMPRSRATFRCDVAPGVALPAQPWLRRCGLVLGQMPLRQRERVAAERVAKLARDHHLQHRGPALALCLGRGAQRRPDVRQRVDALTVCPHRLRHGSPGWLLVEIHSDEPVGIEIDVVLLFRAPLAVVEDDRGDRNSFADAGLQLTEAHAPGPIADVGDRRSLGRGHLGTDDGGKRIATVAEAHRREHRARALEAKIRIRDRADVADVGRHHGVIGHCALELAEHLARMHMARIFRDFERPRVLFLRP